MPNVLNFFFHIIFIDISINASCLEITQFKLSTSTYTKDHQIACIEFSKTIRVKNIEYKNSAIVLPLDIFKDRKYNNIRIVTKELHDVILKTFLADKNTKKTIKDCLNYKTPEFKITQIRKLQSPYRIANVEVIFDNSLLVIFGIIKSKNISGDFWISYPENFEIIDENYKKNLKKQIFQEYSKIK